MFRMRTIIGLAVALSFCPLLAGMLAAAERAPGMGHGFLIDKHMAAGLNCASCHGASAPTKAAAATTCLTCHKPDSTGRFAGSGAKPYAFDGGVTMTFNVHQPHFLEIQCTSCHKIHAASVNFCNQCHLMKDMVVP